MKKLFTILLILAVLFSCSITCAEDKEITFRGIEWYSSKTDVEENLLENEEISVQRSSSHDIYRISGTYFANVTSGSDRVDEGGIVGQYKGVKVAGYEIPITYIHYIYPVTDKKISHDDEQAQMYLIWYPFKSNDFADHVGIHDDLSEKLTGLYGKGKVDKTNAKYYTTTTWKDEKGNTILLLINADKNYTSLAYMAAGADKKLDEMKQALKDEAIELEKQQREENANNTDGL